MTKETDMAGGSAAAAMRDGIVTDGGGRNDDWERARRELRANDALGCVACRGEETLTGSGRGVKPLLAWLAAGQRLDGFSASDRVIGKAAAMLYIRLGAVAVHGCVMSEAGLAMLESHGVAAAYDELVPMIRNRADTGMCPIERSVRDVDDPAEVEAPIRAAVARLMAAQ